MPRKPQHVTDAELAVLRLLWKHEALTARDIREQLYPEGTASDHGTVQKLLQRLEEKDLVARDRSEFAHRFCAKASQSDLVGQQLESLAKKLTDGSLVPFITHMVENKKLTQTELSEIRRLLVGQK